MSNALESVEISFLQNRSTLLQFSYLLAHKESNKKSHLGAVCDWFRQQFMESYETREPALVIHCEGGFSSCGIGI
jgi:hypothetical protein